MISRCSCFRLQPRRTSSSASQSSSSGWVGQLAEHAEVAGRVDQPAAEMVQPDPVDQHAADQRVRAAGQVPGVGQPPAGRRLACGVRA